MTTNQTQNVAATESAKLGETTAPVISAQAHVDRARSLPIVNLASALEIAQRRGVEVTHVLHEMGALILNHRDI